MFRGTVVPAVATALLALAGPGVAAEPVWTGSDSQTIVIQDGVVTGGAQCHAAGAELGGGRYVAVHAYAWDSRRIPMTVTCTLWQGGEVVLEATGGGRAKGTATAAGSDLVPAAPTRVCVWGTWTDQGHTVGYGSRDC